GRWVAPAGEARLGNHASPGGKCETRESPAGIIRHSPLYPELPAYCSVSDLANEACAQTSSYDVHDLAFFGGTHSCHTPPLATYDTRVVFEESCRQPFIAYALSRLPISLYSLEG